MVLINFNRYRYYVGFDWAWPTHGTVLLAGAPVPTMGPFCNLLMLCLHGSKHLWSRLIWICDVAQLLAATPALDWTLVLREGRRVGLSRALALGVLLAHRLTSAPCPRRCSAAFRPTLPPAASPRILSKPFSTPRYPAAWPSSLPPATAQHPRPRPSLVPPSAPHRARPLRPLAPAGLPTRPGPRPISPFLLFATKITSQTRLQRRVSFCAKRF